MSLKCLRGLDSEIVDFSIISEDYQKVVMACVDWNIEIHSQAGKYFKIRVPKIPRSLFFDKFSADMMISCSSNEIFRLNLQ